MELARYLPGAYAGRELLRLGARVVRVEARGGDPMREGAPAWDEALRRGKESVVAALPDEAAFVRALCGRADVVPRGISAGGRRAAGNRACRAAFRGRLLLDHGLRRRRATRRARGSRPSTTSAGRGRWKTPPRRRPPLPVADLAARRAGSGGRDPGGARWPGTHRQGLATRRVDRSRRSHDLVGFCALVERSPACSPAGWRATGRTRPPTGDVPTVRSSSSPSSSSGSASCSAGPSSRRSSTRPTRSRSPPSSPRSSAVARWPSYSRSATARTSASAPSGRGPRRRLTSALTAGSAETSRWARTPTPGVVTSRPARSLRSPGKAERGGQGEEVRNSLRGVGIAPVAVEQERAHAQ